MPPTLRTASSIQDEELRLLIDAAFHRTDRESRLAEELARAHPDFDPGLSLVSELDDRPVGWALFFPRTVLLRGAWVPLSIAGPYGTHPAYRNRGVQRQLFETGLAALRDRGLRGAIALGDPGFLTRFGFGSAFDHYAVHVPLEVLPEEGDTGHWRGLAAEHLEALCAIHEQEGGDGCERRKPASPDWASFVSEAHTLVLEVEGRVEAYLRFRTRERLEIPECGVRTAAATEPLLRFLRRLAREHGRAFLDVHVPPTHPVGRALFHLGCNREANNLGGGAMLAITDWDGFFADTAESWRTALERAGCRACSLEIDGVPYRLARTWRGLRVERRRDARHAVALPHELVAGLMTGQRDFRDLDGIDADARLLRALFPGGTPAWTFAPVFELAAE